jgi:hypothetical protein
LGRVQKRSINYYYENGDVGSDSCGNARTAAKRGPFWKIQYSVLAVGKRVVQKKKAKFNFDHHNKSATVRLRADVQTIIG